MKNKKAKTGFLAFITGIIVIVSLLQNNTIFAAASNTNTVNFTDEFELMEYDEILGEQENVSSININLPSSSWNVTQVELNFTNIKDLFEVPLALR